MQGELLYSGGIGSLADLEALVALDHSGQGILEGRGAKFALDPGDTLRPGG